MSTLCFVQTWVCICGIPVPVEEITVKQQKQDYAFWWLDAEGGRREFDFNRHNKDCVSRILKSLRWCAPSYALRPGV